MGSPRRSPARRRGTEVVEPPVPLPPPVAPNVTRLLQPEMEEPHRLALLPTKRRYAFVIGLVAGVVALEALQALFRGRPAAIQDTLTAQGLSSLPSMSSSLNTSYERIVSGLPTSLSGSLAYLTNANLEQIARLLPEKTWLGRDFGISVEEMLEMMPVEQHSWLSMWSTPTPAAADDSGGAAARPGQQAAASGMRPHHPVVMIPGIITSGLEMWAGHECARSYFRQRLWGTMSMFKLFMVDKECWVSHMQLNATTGGDPAGVKVRAAQGFEAADYAVGGYWVWTASGRKGPGGLVPERASTRAGLYTHWLGSAAPSLSGGAPAPRLLRADVSLATDRAPVIENLADLGYEASNMWMAAYDWRLPFAQLETRDQFFSRLRFHIEMFRRVHGVRVAVLCHSMGGNLWLYFQQWLSSPHGARLSSAWLDEHVERVVLIGSPLLGAPKVIAGMLMGESRDFTHVTGLLARLVDAVLSPAARRRLLRSWGSAQSLLPLGGDAVWGGADGAPDDVPPRAATASGDAAAGGGSDGGAGAQEAPTTAPTTAANVSYGLVMRRLGAGGGAPAPARAAAAEAAIGAEGGQCRSAPATGGADGQCTAVDGEGDDAADGAPAATTAAALRRLAADAAARAADGGFRTWHDQGAPWLGASAAPLLQPPPEAWSNPLLAALPYAPNLTIHCLYGVGKPTERAYAVREVEPAGGAAAAAAAAAEAPPPLAIDRSVNGLSANGVSMVNGVLLSDGDGSVPLLTLGYMCASGWRRASHNPSGSSVVLREYAHRPTEPDGVSSFAAPLERSPRSADHVDILGNHELLHDVLAIVSGGAPVEERLVSDIQPISARVDARIERATAAARAASTG